MSESEAIAIVERIHAETTCRAIHVKPLAGFVSHGVHVISPSGDRQFVFRNFDGLVEYRTAKPESLELIVSQTSRRGTMRTIQKKLF